jgi:hypothetical protein
MSWRSAAPLRYASTTMITRRNNRTDCPHANLQHLGDDRDVRFLRCEACRMVFVLHEGEAWGIPPVQTQPKASDPH